MEATLAHLVIVEDGVGHGVLPWDCGGPQLLHEEHLVGERRHNSCGKVQSVTQRVPGQTGAHAQHQPLAWVPPRWASWYGFEPAPALLWASDDPRTQPHFTILDRPCFLYPVRQVSNKVEEEVILRHADDLRTWPFQSTHFNSSNTEFSDFPIQDLPGGPFSTTTPPGSQKGCRVPAHPAPTVPVEYLQDTAYLE